jgi:hypothetical protein
MGTFAETAIVDLVYRLPTKKNKLPFSISVCSKQTEVCRFRFLYIYTHICKYISTENGKKWQLSVCNGLNGLF